MSKGIVIVIRTRMDNVPTDAISVVSITTPSHLPKQAVLAADSRSIRSPKVERAARTGQGDPIAKRDLQV
ncbi:hypothetical protein NEUTE2DRAFT_127040 [Neurospora tetrasperma FGSC 2509]|nr:hypothetical protein NEUTE2DRAFT_127040 [Neurospora tetrasperma FGSC 2509]